MMAERVLAIIPEADVSVAVTGHLGPHAPPELDGLVFIAVGLQTRKVKQHAIAVQVKRFQLPKATRLARQKRAVEAALRWLASQLEMNPA
jgi:nicotinamide mononucleotide (NMN) deamidase PncC